MAKVLSQSGISLADTYAVEGSIAGVEELLTKDVHLSHEMGGTIFSERLETNVTRLNPGAIAQNVTWAVTLVPPDSPNRILGVCMIIDTTARVTHASLAIGAVTGVRECPIWSWDIANDAEQAITISIDGATVGVEILMLPGFSLLPQMLTRSNGVLEGNLMGNLIYRGLTAGFGAGTVLPLMFCLLARANQAIPDPGQPSSHGLPIPSW